MTGSWGCSQGANDLCLKVNNLPRDRGMTSKSEELSISYWSQLAHYRSTRPSV